MRVPTGSAHRSRRGRTSAARTRSDVTHRTRRDVMNGRRRHGEATSARSLHVVVTSARSLHAVVTSDRSLHAVVTSDRSLHAAVTSDRSLDAAVTTDRSPLPARRASLGRMRRTPLRARCRMATARTMHRHRPPSAPRRRVACRAARPTPHRRKAPACVSPS